MGHAMSEPHCEHALRQIQRVVTIASAEDAPITMREALEQIVETLDLAGFGPMEMAAARALLAHTQLTAAEIVREALAIAGGIDIYTNGNLTVEELACPT